ncbi:MAG: hypothetical protein KGO96_13180 [Elusimicrobia bacterium]|nr:hypothetical protein [Elusimicrobiota bacterium]
MEATIQGIQVRGTAEEIGALLRTYVPPTTAASEQPRPIGHGSQVHDAKGTVNLSVAKHYDRHLPLPAVTQYLRAMPYLTSSSLAFTAADAFSAPKRKSPSTGTFEVASVQYWPKSAPAGLLQSPSADDGTTGQKLTVSSTNRALDAITRQITEYRPRLFSFHCRVGPTDVHHDVSAGTPKEAIESHDAANPRHRFVNAAEVRVGERREAPVLLA